MSDLLNSYIDQKMFLNKLLNQSGSTSNSFFRNNQDTLPKGGGLNHGSGLAQNTASGLDDKEFKKKKPFVKEAVNTIKSDEKEVKSEEPDEVKDGDIPVSGSVGSSSSSSSPEEESSVVAPVGFSGLIEGFGEPFKSSKSRKSIVFVPNDKALPLKGWKSIRNAGLSSKKIGKINKNGDSIVHTSKDGNDGKMYFLSNQSWNALKRKKKIVIE